MQHGRHKQLQNIHKYLYTCRQWDKNTSHETSKEQKSQRVKAGVEHNSNIMREVAGDDALQAKYEAAKLSPHRRQVTTLPQHWLMLDGDRTVIQQPLPPSLPSVCSLPTPDHTHPESNNYYVHL